jgi:hypothetical protein
VKQLSLFSLVYYFKNIDYFYINLYTFYSEVCNYFFLLVAFVFFVASCKTMLLEEFSLLAENKYMNE